MKKAISLLSFFFITTLLQAQFVDSLVLMRTYTKAQIDSVLNANGVPAAFLGTQYDIEAYKVYYNTVSYDSTPLRATGFLAFPKGGCRYPMASFGHGTVSKKNDVPSAFDDAMSVLGMAMASIGYVSTLPDYIGLGETSPDLLHPYQHAATEASATIDLLRAAREAGDSLGYETNGQVFLTGYSQGGHTAMATHKTIQEKLNGDLVVTASCPMSGAYSMSGVMVDVMLSNDPYAVPGYLPYLTLSWSPIYQMFPTVNDFLTTPYNTSLPPLFDGTYGMGYINSQMPSVPKQIFKQELLDSFTTNLNHPFRLALKENDVWDWKPECPVRIIFTRADEEVKWDNAVVLYNSFVSKGATNIDTVCISETFSHYQAAQYAILAMKTYFDAYKVVECENNVKEQRDFNPENVLSPNPADGVIRYFKNIETEVYQVKVSDLTGRIYGVSFFNEKYWTEINIADLPHGIYTTQIVNNKNETYRGKFIKK